MWQISKTLWINPENIIYCTDFPEKDMIQVGFITRSKHIREDCIDCEGEERQAVLNYLNKVTHTIPLHTAQG